MKKTNDGGPAFCGAWTNLNGVNALTGEPSIREVQSPGMTVRDYFAAHVTWEEIKTYLAGMEYTAANMAMARMKIADAMLFERNKEAK